MRAAPPNPVRSLYVLGVVGALSALPASTRHVAQLPAPIAEAEPLQLVAPVAPVVAVPTASPVTDTGTLIVRVATSDGQVAGAEVSLSDGSRPTLATAITDAEGVARFTDLPPGPYEVWARRDAMVSELARVSTPGSAAGVSLVLAPATTVHGRLVADAIPRGATITLVPVDVDHAMRIVSIDDTGRFAVEGVPRGRWRIESAAAGYVQTGERVVAIDRDRGDLAVTMARTGAVSGLVVDGAGAPVDHATIVLRRLGADAVTDRSPVARLRWVHPLAGRRVLPAAEVLRFGAPRSGARPAECGQGHCGVDIGWQRGTVIHAAADGEIALAFADSHGEAGRSIAIDHGGGLKSYYMHLDALRPGLEVGQPIRAGDALGTMGSTGLAHGPHLHFAITQERDGRTWYVDPEPVLRQAVVLATARSLDPIDARDAPTIAAIRHDPPERIAPGTLATDAYGRFRVDDVAPGAYVAVAFASTLAPGTSEQFTVVSGSGTADVAIALHPGVLVQGRVTGGRGPIAGAIVVAGAGNGETAHKVASTTTSAQGEFTLRALSGAITLSVTAPGHGTMERTLELADQGPRRREDFSLVIENAQLRGQVLAPDGGPAGAAVVRVVDGPTRRTITTDAGGRFVIDHAAAGSYQLEVSSDDFPAIRVAAHSDHWAEIRFARGGSLRCDLRDRATAAPLTGVRVEATGPDHRVATAISDGRGFADLRALPPGEWTIRVRVKGFSPIVRTVAVRPTTIPDDVRLELARGATLSGVVRDRSGHRVAGARVFAEGVETQADGDGNFRLEAPSGRYWLSAELGGARGAIELSLEPGGERATLSIELE